VNKKPSRHRFGFSLAWDWQYLLMLMESNRVKHAQTPMFLNSLWLQCLNHWTKECYCSEASELLPPISLNFSTGAQSNYVLH
jgi:hypothetical protein